MDGHLSLWPCVLTALPMSLQPVDAGFPGTRFAGTTMNTISGEPSISSLRQAVREGNVNPVEQVEINWTPVLSLFVAGESIEKHFSFWFDLVFEYAVIYEERLCPGFPLSPKHCSINLRQPAICQLPKPHLAHEAAQVIVSHSSRGCLSELRSGIGTQRFLHLR